MSRRTGFKNIQVQGKIELAELFEDTYEQSGANSKAEFLGILIDEYLNPKQQNKDNLTSLVAEKEEIERSVSELKADLDNLNQEKDELKGRLAIYENDLLKKLLKKHAGKTLKFRNPQGERIHLTISDLPDVYQAVINSIQI